MFDESEFLKRAHLDNTTLEIWIREEWVIPSREQGGAPSYSEADLARARLIHDLRHNMGVNDEGLGLVLHLIDQVHGLRRALAQALGSLHERDAAR